MTAKSLVAELKEFKLKEPLTLAVVMVPPVPNGDVKELEITPLPTPDEVN